MSFFVDFISKLVSDLSVEIVVAFSVEIDEGAEVIDIGTAASSLCGSSVLDTEDDVRVTVSCVDTSDVTSPELSCSSEGNMVGFAVLNKEEDVVAKVSLP